MTQHEQATGKTMNTFCQCKESSCHGEWSEDCQRKLQCWLMPVRELQPQIGLCPACARNGLENGRLMEAADKDIAYRRLAYALNQRENRGLATAASEYRLQWFNQDGTAQFEHRWKRIWVKLRSNGDYEVEPRFRLRWQTCLWAGCGIGLIWALGGKYPALYVLVLIAVIPLTRIYGWLEKQKKLRDEITQQTDLFWLGKMQHPTKETIKTQTANTVLRFSALKSYK